MNKYEAAIRLFISPYTLHYLFFFLNMLQDYLALEPYRHEMLSWVKLRGINAHSVSPQGQQEETYRPATS